MPRLVKGDTVLVVTGNDAGKTGKVLKVFPEKDRVIVEGRARPPSDMGAITACRSARFRERGSQSSC